MSLKCCNRVCQILESVTLLDTQTRTHRLLTIGRCRNPKCGALRAQILYYDSDKGKFQRETIRSKDVKRVLEYYKNNPSAMTVPNELQKGSRQNQQWIYGITRQCQVNGESYIEHWACNFNNEKRLVERKKIIDERVNI